MENTIADTIYMGGPIVTMIRDNDRVEALAVKNGRIMMTGKTDEVMALKGPETKVIDLKGRAMMPGFIDPHSHLILQSAKFATVSLDPFPIGDVKTIGDIQRKLREHIERKKIPAGALVIGSGYDETVMAEKRHPTRDDLDAVSTDHPIVLFHITFHVMTGNSNALELAGVTPETPDPKGGVIQRKADGKTPNGVFEEQAYNYLVKLIPVPTAGRATELVEEGVRRYAAEGITTACDGGAFASTIKLLRSMEKAGKLPIDVIAWPLYMIANDDVVEDAARSWKKMGRFRIGGLKLITDGAVQSWTAYMSKPYLKTPAQAAAAARGCNCSSTAGLKLVLGDEAADTPPESKSAATQANRGYPRMSQDEIEKWVRLADEKGIPLQIHSNGDAEIDLLINALKKVRGDWPRPDLRTTLVHAQTIREDQLDFAANNGLIPSFFPIHIRYWGDRHISLFLGPERASRISPSRSALDRGMKITIHHDAPVAGAGILPVVSIAVNRETSGGQILGPEQRISIYEAFRAFTKDAAYQYFEENRKGTLEADKLADMVILDRDPLKVEPKKIQDIKVMETIKEGKTVFLAK